MGAKDDKKFRTAILGFRKSDVILYMQQILREFKQVIWQKDNKISSLRDKLALIKDSNEDKAQIADVLIKAHHILEEAKQDAEKERKKYQEEIYVYKQQIIKLKQDIEELQKCLKSACSVIAQYEDDNEHATCQVC